MSGSRPAIKNPRPHPYTSKPGDSRHVIIGTVKNGANTGKHFVCDGHGEWARVDSCTKENFDSASAEVFGSRDKATGVIGNKFGNGKKAKPQKRGVKRHSKHPRQVVSRSF